MTVVFESGETPTPAQAKCFAKLTELFKPPDRNLVSTVSMDVDVKRLSY